MKAVKIQKMVVKGKRCINGILVIYNHNLCPYASNMFEHIKAFRENSRFPVWEVNTHFGFPEVLRELEFKVIVLHYSIFGWTSVFLSEEFLEYLGESGDSYKIAFFQDEYRYWPERSEVLNRFKVDCVYTCIEPEYYDATYRKYTRVPRLVTYLPGYVSEEMVRWAGEVIKPDRQRRIDVGYRGRRSYHYMGKAAREKHEIGTRFLELASGSGLSMDITSEESKRIYGRQWLGFLGDCRAVLGVEAGVSIFDIDNVVIPQYQKMVAENPEITFEEVYGRLLFQYDGKGIYYRTMSPRVFEAAAVRSCQILFEGRYSGILEPMVHYIPLKKDFSNFEEVLRMYRDESIRRELTENAHRDLISSGRYSYREFMREFDEGLEAAGVEIGIPGEVEDRVTEWLNEGGRSLLVKKIGVQQREYQELVNRDVALQVQYMEQQRQLQKLAEAHQSLQVQYMEQQKRLQQLIGQRAALQGPEIGNSDWNSVIRPRELNFHGAGAYTGGWGRFVKVTLTNWGRSSKVFIANALRACPLVYKVVRSIWSGFQKSE